MENIIDSAALAVSDFEPYSFDASAISFNLHKHGYAIVKNLLEPELLEQIYHEMVELDNNNDLTAAAVGRGDDHAFVKSIRTDKTKWIDGDSLPQRLFLETLEQIRVEVNRELMLGLFDVEAHYAVYKPGAFYKRHFDSFVGQRNRLLSVVIYFNKDWREEDGGQLNLYNNIEDEKPFMSVAPQWGTSVFFLSEEMPHEVAVSNNDRYSIAAWFHCRQPL